MKHIDAFTWYALTVNPQRLAITAKRLRLARDGNVQPEPTLQTLLNREGFATFLPVRQEFRKPHRYAKTRDKVERLYPLLPGYLFIGMSERTPSWHGIFRFDLVRGVIGMNGEPAVIPTRNVADLNARSASGAFKAPGFHQAMHTHREFSPGDAAELLTGPLAGATIRVEEIEGLTAKFRHMFFGVEREFETPLENLVSAA